MRLDACTSLQQQLECVLPAPGMAGCLCSDLAPFPEAASTPRNLHACNGSSSSQTGLLLSTQTPPARALPIPSDQHCAGAHAECTAQLHAQPDKIGYLFFHSQDLEVAAGAFLSFR